MIGKCLVTSLKLGVLGKSRCKESVLLCCSRSFSAITYTATSATPPSIRSPRKFNSFPFTYHEVVEVKIENICNLGSGVGKYKLEDDKLWTIFVPNVLPGEICKVRIYRNFSSFSESDLGKCDISIIILAIYVFMYVYINVL